MKRKLNTIRDRVTIRLVDNGLEKTIAYFEDQLR
jgi:hypothetical protein